MGLAYLRRRREKRAEREFRVKSGKTRNEGNKKQKKLRNLAIPELSAEERTRTFTGLTPTRPST